MLGGAYRALGRRQEALAAYERSIDYGSRFAAAYNNKGGLLAELGKPQEAFECFRTALILNPWDSMAYRNIGSLYAWEGDLDQAIRAGFPEQIVALRDAQPADTGSGEAKAEELVFGSRSGKPLDPGRVRMIVRRAAQRAGVAESVSPELSVNC